MRGKMENKRKENKMRETKNLVNERDGQKEKVVIESRRKIGQKDKNKWKEQIKKHGKRSLEKHKN